MYCLKDLHGIWLTEYLNLGWGLKKAKSWVGIKSVLAFTFFVILVWDRISILLKNKFYRIKSGEVLLIPDSFSLSSINDTNSFNMRINHPEIIAFIKLGQWEWGLANLAQQLCKPSICVKCATFFAMESFSFWSTFSCQREELNREWFLLFEKKNYSLVLSPKCRCPE
jgi:hypothetical protein